MMKILLLEDNKKLNDTIIQRLSIKGYEVDTFYDGNKANKALSNKYKCFILDINVPNIDGIKVMKNIRDYYPQSTYCNYKLEQRA